jgi:hypothetical protein
MINRPEQIYNDEGSLKNGFELLLISPVKPLKKMMLIIESHYRFLYLTTPI